MATSMYKDEDFGPLHSAAVTGDKESLKNIFKNNLCDVNSKDKLGRNPLIFAILGDHPDCVEALLQQGARPDCLDNIGRNALHWATFLGHVGCIKTLLNWKGFGQTSQWHQVDETGVSILHTAALKLTEQSDIFRQILKNFKNENGNINIQDENGRTPLHWASSAGNHECMSLLLKHRASVDLVDNEKKTALHLAVCSASPRIDKVETKEEKEAKEERAKLCTEILIGAANHTVNWRDYEGRTALHLVVANMESDLMLKSLLATGLCDVNLKDRNGCTPLHFAAQLGKETAVTLLLDRGASASVQDINGATPIHYATDSKSIDTVERLMKHPDVFDNTPDHNGRTGLMWAAAKGEATLIQVMCRHGADPNFKDENGDTALHLAVASNHVEAANALIHLGSDLHLENGCGQTALFHCARLGHSESTVLLLSLGAKTDQSDNRASLPIHVACRGGHTTIAQILLHHSPPDLIKEVDIYGRTSLIQATSGGYVECAKFLIENGAEMNVTDHQGMSAVHWAVVRGHLDVVRLLVDLGAFLNNIANLPHGKIQETFMPGWKKKQKTFWEKSKRRELSSPSEQPAIYDTSRMTPLDIAILCKETEICDFLIDDEALTFRQIKEIAATRIQTLYRSYKIRTCFEEHKDLLLKHERLRASKKLPNSKDQNLNQNSKDKGSKMLDRQNERVRVRSRRDARIENVAGSFLGQIVSEARESAFLKKNKNED